MHCLVSFPLLLLLVIWNNLIGVLVSCLPFCACMSCSQSLCQVHKKLSKHSFRWVSEWVAEWINASDTCEFDFWLYHW
jgi:hypothetical protein